jgi:hypothetical protein
MVVLSVIVSELDQGLVLECTSVHGRIVVCKEEGEEGMDGKEERDVERGEMDMNNR